MSTLDQYTTTYFYPASKARLSTATKTRPSASNNENESVASLKTGMAYSL
jgi:hypothetical protein